LQEKKIEIDWRRQLGASAVGDCATLLRLVPATKRLRVNRWRRRVLSGQDEQGHGRSPGLMGVCAGKCALVLYGCTCNVICWYDITLAHKAVGNAPFRWPCPEPLQSLRVTHQILLRRDHLLIRPKHRESGEHCHCGVSSYKLNKCGDVE